MEHSHYLKFRREDMIAFRKATKGMLCDDIYIHMWNLIRKEFEDYESIPPTIYNVKYGHIAWWKDYKCHRLFDLPASRYKERELTWNIDGKYHRDWDLPAIIHLKKGGWCERFEWYQNNLLHREGDKPAAIRRNGLHWYNKGVIHREGDKPAIISDDGNSWWIQNNRLYREDNKPTIVKADGTQIWATSDKNWCLLDIKVDPMWAGQRNFQIDPNGTMRWFINNKPGRENDAPAIIYSNGTQVWYSIIGLRHVIHRDGDQPAIICKDGSKSWYYQGKLIACFKHGKFITRK